MTYFLTSCVVSTKNLGDAFNQELLKFADGLCSTRGIRCKVSYLKYQPRLC